MSEYLQKILAYAETLDLPNGDYLKVTNALKQAYEDKDIDVKKWSLHIRIYPDHTEPSYLEIVEKQLRIAENTLTRTFSWKMYDGKNYRSGNDAARENLHKFVDNYLMTHNAFNVKIRTPTATKVYTYEKTLRDAKFELETELKIAENDEEYECIIWNQSRYSGYVAAKIVDLVE
jgi:hypothetical protein